MKECSDLNSDDRNVLVYPDLHIGHAAPEPGIDLLGGEPNLPNSKNLANLTSNVNNFSDTSVMSTSSSAPESSHHGLSVDNPSPLVTDLQQEILIGEENAEFSNGYLDQRLLSGVRNPENHFCAEFDADSNHGLLASRTNLEVDDNPSQSHTYSPVRTETSSVTSEPASPAPNENGIPIPTDPIIVPPPVRRIADRHIASFCLLSSAVIRHLLVSVENNDQQLQCNLADLYLKLPVVFYGGLNRLNADRVSRDIAALLDLLRPPEITVGGSLYNAFNVLEPIFRTIADDQAEKIRNYRPVNGLRQPTVKQLAILVNQNARTKAVQLLSSYVSNTGLAPFNETSRQAFMNLTPQRPQPIYPHYIGPDYPDPPQLVSTTPDTLLKFIKRSKNRAATGVTGWTNELYKQLCCSTIPAARYHLEDLCHLVDCLIAGKLLASASIWNRQCGIPLYKDPVLKKIRPICIGEPIIKLACKVAVSRVMIREYLEPLQLGVGSPAGCETVAHLLQITAALVLDEAERVDTHDYVPTIGILQTDTANAFNQLDRLPIWNQVCKVTPYLRGIFQQVYGSSNAIFFPTGMYVGHCTTGTRQGCVLGSFLYCLTTHPVLQSLQNSFPNTVVRAIADDIHIIGPPPVFDQVLTTLAALYAPLGLTLNLDKCKSWNCMSPHEGLKCLGSPIGTSNYQLSVSNEELKVQEQIIELLTTLPCSLGITLIRQCANVSPHYLVRTTPTLSIMERVKAFDACVDDAIVTLISPIRDSLHRPAQLIRALPVSKGGLGIPRLEYIASTGFLSSQLRVLPHIQNTTPSIAASIRTSLSSILTDFWKVIHQYSPTMVSTHPLDNSKFIPRMFLPDLHIPTVNIASITQSSLMKKVYQDMELRVESMLVNHLPEVCVFQANQYKPNKFSTFLLASLQSLAGVPSNGYGPVEADICYSISKRLLLVSHPVCPHCDTVQPSMHEYTCKSRSRQHGLIICDIKFIILKLLRLLFGNLAVRANYSSNNHNFDIVISDNNNQIIRAVDVLVFPPEYAVRFSNNTRHYSTNLIEENWNLHHDKLPAETPYNVLYIPTSGNIKALKSFIMSYSNWRGVVGTIPRGYLESSLLQVAHLAQRIV